MVDEAGPVAVGADSAAAEIRRLGQMLMDDTDSSIRVRPVYPPVPPVWPRGGAGRWRGVSEGIAGMAGFAACRRARRC